MLLGRGPQKHALTAALSRAAAGQGGSVLLTGPVGSGFTALLDEVAAGASAAPADWLVLRTRAAPDEASLPHALLHQVVSPLLDELGDDLDGARRSSLEAAVGARAPDEGRVPVAMATLGALEVLARRRPLLVIVDDAQWADPDSAAVLRFLGRRLARAAVCLVLVLPDGAPGQLPGDRVTGGPADATGADEVVVLTGLSEAESLTWVDSELPGLDPLRRSTLVDLSAGRPRRLSDLLRLSGPTADADPGPGSRPALRGSLLASVAAARLVVAGAPVRVRRELVARGLLDDPVGASLTAGVAAVRAEGGGSAGGARPVGAAGYVAGPVLTADAMLCALAADEADPALVVELRTAWARSLEASAPTAPPAAARRMQAEALRQRVLSDAGAGLALAAPLEAAARSLRAVDAQRSGELYALAAEHHRDDLARAAALHRAAALALGSGRHRRAGALADAAAALAPADRGVGTVGEGAPARAALAWWRAVAALCRGDRSAAVDHLEDALAHLVVVAALDHQRGGAEAADDAVAAGAALVLVAGRRRRSPAALDAAVAALPPAAAERLRSVSHLALPWGRAVPSEQQRALADAVEVLARAALPVLRLAAEAGRLLGRSDRVAQLGRVLVTAWPATGPAAVDLHLAMTATALDLSGLHEARRHLLRARAALRDAPEAAPAVGQAELLLECLATGSVPDAALVGDSELPETTERAGAVWCRAHHHRLRGDLTAAAAELLVLWPPDDAPASAGALLQTLPTVYALHESGADPAALARVVDQATAWAQGSGAALAVSTALACRAVVSSEPEEQQQLLEASVEAAGEGVEGAAPRLALGMLLRRTRQGVSAREPLTAALRLYEDHGQIAFAELARRELRATAPQRPPRRRGSAVLTGQERTVAALAAKGLANADIARSLGISARTVAHHLQHVYAKLGVTGRQQLRARLRDL